MNNTLIIVVNVLKIAFVSLTLFRFGNGVEEAGEERRSRSVSDSFNELARVDWCSFGRTVRSISKYSRLDLHACMFSSMDSNSGDCTFVGRDEYVSRRAEVF